MQLVERLVGALTAMRTPPRLVHLGTIHEYGPVPFGTAIHEDTPPAPTNPYGQTKLTASRMVLDAVRNNAFDGVVLRVANTVGPHPSLESFFGSLAVRLRDVDAATGIELTIADAERDYVDVRDAVDAVARAARSTLADPLVNIGCGQAMSVRKLVTELVTAAGLPVEAIQEQRGEVHSRGGDWVQVDISRAARLLGWRPGSPSGNRCGPCGTPSARTSRSRPGPPTDPGARAWGPARTGAPGAARTRCTSARQEAA